MSQGKVFYFFKIFISKDICKKIIIQNVLFIIIFIVSEIEQFMGFDRVDFENEPLYDENLCSVLYNSQKTGLLITGCLGRVIIWQNNGSVSWISPLFDENSYVTHITLLEPSDDPRPFFYLWIASQVCSIFNL